MNKSDQELISKYKETHNQEYVASLYEKYMSLVYGVALKYLKDKEDSKDVVMQLYEKLLSDLKKHEVSNFKSWLHVMTKNHCLMKIRSGKAHMSVELEKDLEESMEYAVEPHHMDEDTSEVDTKALNKCLKKLPQEQNECVKLFYLEERSYRQIVDISGYDLKKVKSYIQNGKRNLRLCLEKNAA